MMRILRTVAAVTIAAVLAAPAGPAAQANAEVALRAAMETETVKGDLKAAIEQYKKVATSSDRAIAARALLRLAECYQKLGDSESQRVYERLVRDFADQPDAVAAARARLGGARVAGSGMVARQLWTMRGFSEVAVASDGRSAAVGAAREVEIRDLTKDRVTRLTVANDPRAYAEWPVLSADNKQVAYAFAGPETKWAYQLRISGTQPDGPTRSVGNTFPYLYVMGWMPDSSAVLAIILAEGNHTQIAWISTADGSVRTLKSLDWRGLDRLSLSPDGRFIAYAVLVEQGKADREIRILASDGSREAIVAAAPGINVSPVWSRDGSELVFMSDRSGAFGIWSIAVRDGRAAGSPTRLKADVGNIRLIGFTASSSLLYDQTIGSRDVFQIALDARGAALSGEPRSMIDRFQGWNWHPAESPDGQSLAYLSRRPGIPDGWANLIIRSLESGAERVMPTLMRAGGGGGGIPIWLPDGHSLIVPTRNSQNHTVLTKIDVRSGDVVTLVDTGGSNPNAAALSPDGRTAYAFAGAPVLAGAYDLASGRRVDFSHAGNAKSIAASPDGHLVAFIAWESDRVPTPTHLYVADVETRRVRAILTSEKSDDMISGIWGGVDWSPDSRFIYFLRQNQGALWRIAAAGGAPTLVGELAKQPVRTIDVSRDGRHVIFATDQRSDTVEVWTLENVLQAGRRPSP